MTKAKKGTLKNKLKQLFKIKKNTVCPFCQSYNTQLNKTLVTGQGRVKDREFVVECNDCNAIGIKKESWYQGSKLNEMKNKSLKLTDIEISID